MNAAGRAYTCRSRRPSERVLTARFCYVQRNAASARRGRLWRQPRPCRWGRDGVRRGQASGHWATPSASSGKMPPSRDTDHMPWPENSIGLQIQAPCYAIRDENLQLL